MSIFSTQASRLQLQVPDTLKHRKFVDYERLLFNCQAFYEQFQKCLKTQHTHA